MPPGLNRRAFLYAVLAGATRPLRASAQPPSPEASASPAVARQSGGGSAAERLVAAIQDGGKIIYLRPPAPEDMGRAEDLGRALRALRVPLNEIVTSPVAPARETAERAFGAERAGVMMELAPGEHTGDRLNAMIQAVQRMLRTEAGPGMNRVLIGDRTPLEMAAERRFPDAVLPEGGMAVFLPGGSIQLLGTITAARVIASAKARGAL